MEGREGGRGGGGEGWGGGCGGGGMIRGGKGHSGEQGEAIDSNFSQCFNFTIRLIHKY